MIVYIHKVLLTHYNVSVSMVQDWADSNSEDPVRCALVALIASKPITEDDIGGVLPRDKIELYFPPILEFGWVVENRVRMVSRDLGTVRHFSVVPHVSSMMRHNFLSNISDEATPMEEQSFHSLVAWATQRVMNIMLAQIPQSPRAFSDFDAPSSQMPN